MYCRKCGTEMTEDSEFCPACGTPVYEVPASEEDLEFHRTMSELFHEEQEEELRKAFVRRILCFVVPFAFGGIMGYICYADEPINAVIMALALAPFFWVGYVCFQFCHSQVGFGFIVSIVAGVALMLLVSRIFYFVPSSIQTAVMLILIAVWYIWYVLKLKRDYSAWKSLDTDEKTS